MTDDEAMAAYRAMMAMPRYDPGDWRRAPMADPGDWLTEPERAVASQYAPNMADLLRKHGPVAWHMTAGYEDGIEMGACAALGDARGGRAVNVGSRYARLLAAKAVS